MASTQASQRRRGRPKTADSTPLDDILEAGLAAFATYGYEGVSLRMLNRELGVSHNLIYQRFGGKDDLWRAAIDFGFGPLLRIMQGIFDPTLTEPLEQFRLAIRRYVVFSADHPQLVALMNIEARQDTDRLSYIYDTYIEPALSGVGRLLLYLAEQRAIRPISLREFHFLVSHGAATLYSLVPLAILFDPAPPGDPAAVEEHARLVSDVIVEGLRLHPNG
ncbi:TetR/AcrR family transcriptional regulator [Mycobacterium sp. AZCC_0083]|uniref:TetR/AcrR family transcriptional regulator n=1 Tax=Mycobacterium sp. AZCC_0083 TaxID=2735882 RepID=UPI00160FA8A5|nr:TetR/AcrR family transcriptional regulator [Mycobacterium sp. AZCC_0083]MBB5165357.1 AcrR family transcriptional regulator [Mycobacterium sp. AZCC_0083]